MKPILRIVVALALISALTSCGGSADQKWVKLATEEYDIMEEYADLVESINNAEEAKKAVPLIEELTERMKANRAKLDKLAEPDPTNIPEVAADMSERSFTLLGRCSAFSWDLPPNQELGPILIDTVNAFEKSYTRSAD